MIQNLLKGIAWRSALVFLVIHAGLIASVYGLATFPKTEEFRTAWLCLVWGFAGLYGGLLLGVVFVVWPLWVWVRRIRKILRWRDWILKELPEILALLPAVIQKIREVWNSMRPPSPTPASASTAQDTHTGDKTPSL